MEQSLLSNLDFFRFFVALLEVADGLEDSDEVFEVFVFAEILLLFDDERNKLAL